MRVRCEVYDMWLSVAIVVVMISSMVTTSFLPKQRVHYIKLHYNTFICDTTNLISEKENKV